MTYDEALFAGYPARGSLPRAFAFGPREDRGQALVELALVLPVLILLVLGIIDFGRAFNYKNDVTDLANQAARFAEVNSCTPCASGQTLDGAPGSPGSTSYITSIADSGELRGTTSGGTFGITSPAAVSICFPSVSGVTPGATGTPVQVTVSATYRWLPFFGFGTTTISSTEQARISNAWTATGTNAYLTGGAATC